MACVSLLALGCNRSDQQGPAPAAALQFHDRLNQEKYAEIYGDTDPSFRQVTGEKEFTALLTAVHHGLGDVERADATDFSMNTGGGSGEQSWTTVRYNYRTKFRKADAQETFGWRLSSGKCWLAFYKIDSSALIPAADFQAGAVQSEK